MGAVLAELRIDRQPVGQRTSLPKAHLAVQSEEADRRIGIELLRVPLPLLEASLQQLDIGRVAMRRFDQLRALLPVWLSLGVLALHDLGSVIAVPVEKDGSRDRHLGRLSVRMR